MIMNFSDFFNLLKENNILIVEDVKNADLIVSFGGDGTILSLVPLLKEKIAQFFQ